MAALFFGRVTCCWAPAKEVGFCQSIEMHFDPFLGWPCVNFGPIPVLPARAAAICLVRLVGRPALDRLAQRVDDSLQLGQAKDLAGAIRFAEIEYFGQASLW